MSIPILVFFSAGNRDMHAVCFLFLPNFALIKMGRFFWLQFPHMLRREAGGMRGKEKHFASAGTNSQGGRQASRHRHRIQDLSSCPPPWLLLSSWSHHWEANTGSRRGYPEIWPAVWQYLSGTVVQNIPISAPHSSWLLRTAKGRRKEEIPCWGNTVGYRRTGEQTKKRGYWLTLQRTLLGKNSLSTLVSLKDKYKNFNENFHKNKSTKWGEFHGYISEKFSS